MSSCIEVIRAICSNLRISEDIVTAAIVLADHYSVSQSVGQKFDSNDVALCIVYITLVDKRLSCNSDGILRLLSSADDTLEYLALGDLLQFSKVHIKQFFEMMKDLSEVLSWNNTVSQHLAYVKKQYCLSALMYCKLNRLISQLPSFSINLPDKVGLKSSTWLLYLILRDRLNCTDLVTCLSLLLNCLSYVLVTLDTKVGTCDVSSSLKNVLHQLSDSCQCREETVAMFSTFNEIVSTLPSSDNFLDITSLTNEYDVHWKKMCTINEMLLLDDEETLKAPVSQAERPDNERSPPADDRHRNVCLTPVSRKLAGYRQTVGGVNQGTGDSAIIQQFFQQLASDPLVELRKNLMTTKSSFVSAYVSNTGQCITQIAETRFHLISRLYFSALESICVQYKNMNQEDVAIIFNDSAFHNGLTACAALSVIMACCHNGEAETMTAKEMDFLLSWIVKTFRLNVLDVFKLLSVFIVSTLPLTSDMQKQLQRLEEYIVLTAVWHKESSAWKLLGEYTTGTDSETNKSSTSLYTGVKNQPNFLSPAKRQTPFYLSSFNSPGKCFTNIQSPRKENNILFSVRREGNAKHSTATATPSIALIFCAKDKNTNVLNYLIDKALHASSLKIQDLVRILQIGDTTLVQKINKVVEHCLICQSDLVKDRRLDQVIMCASYAVCKVAEQEVVGKQEVSFRSIIRAYRQLTGESEEMFKKVLISSEENSCIISFYNQVFVNALKSFLVQFASSKPAIADQNRTVSSPVKSYSVPGCSNFMVSPLRQSSEMTPRSGQLYCFGTPGSSEKLRVINETMKLAAGGISNQNSLSSTKRKGDAQFPLRDIDPSSTYRKQLKFDLTNGSI